MRAACPVVDLCNSRTFAGRRQVLAENIVRACAKEGYFALTGHGIPAEWISRARTEALHFFAKPYAEKMKTSANAIYAGYVPRLAEDDPRNVSMPKDAFNAYGANMDEIWQRCPTGFVHAMIRCREAMADLALDLLAGIQLVTGEVLSLEENEDEESADVSLFRAVYYPSLGGRPRPKLDRCESHTDLGSLTILDSEFDSGAFQVLGEDDTWYGVLPPHGSLLVNIGDHFEYLTNGLWRPPIHRVAGPHQGGAPERLSLIFFQNPMSARPAVENYLRSSTIS